jgi:hypothetical protein
MKIQKSDLTVLLNSLYDTGTEQIPVEHPSEEVGELVKFELGEPNESIVRFTKREDDYEEAREKVSIEYGQTAYKDLPEPKEYARSFVASDILELGNQTELEEWLENNGRANINHGQYPCFVGFDTNLYPWRVDTSLEMDPDPEDEKDRPPLINGFAVAEGVQKEMNWGHKHGGGNVHELVEAFGNDFERIINQPGGAQRQGRLGVVQHSNLRSHSYGEGISSEEGDEAIVDAYSRYQENTKKKPILLSNDREFVERAHRNGILSRRVEFDDELPRKTTASWDEIERSVFFLSVLFGVVHLPKVTVYGVWSGKEENEWNQDVLEVEFRSPKVERTAKRYFETIAAYE